MKTTTTTRLPIKMPITVLDEDMEKAVCGSQTHCVLANAIKRTYPAVSFIRVVDEKVTITIHGYTHRYGMAPGGLDVVAASDDDTLELGDQRDFVFPMMANGRNKAADNSDRERKDGINAARAARKAQKVGEFAPGKEPYKRGVHHRMKRALAKGVAGKTKAQLKARVAINEVAP